MQKALTHNEQTDAQARIATCAGGSAVLQQDRESAMQDLKNAAEPGAGEAQAFTDAAAGAARDKIANTLWAPGFVSSLELSGTHASLSKRGMGWLTEFRGPTRGHASQKGNGK